MRTSSLFIAAAAILVLTGSGVADPTVRAEFRFSRGATSADQFHSDLRTCQIAAKRLEWTQVPSNWNNGMARATRVSVSAGALQSCMGDKGYRLDPHGYRTGWMRTSA